jgi:hypothetical protein
MWKKGEINDISTLLIIESFGRFTLQMGIFFFPPPNNPIGRYVEKIWYVENIVWSHGCTMFNCILIIFSNFKY